MAAGQPEDAESLRELLGVAPGEIKPDQYVLMQPEQDREAAHRWHVLNEIRKSNASVKNKIIDYFRRNPGKRITGEELKYLAKDRKEWARRVRELRTEDGWPIVTRNSGRRDLDVGVYVLEEDRQAQEHDRRIPDPVRVEVLERDQFQCVKCGWSRSASRHDDPRTRLELHHEKPHSERGDNTVGNLVTVCNFCHDQIHRSRQGGLRIQMKSLEEPSGAPVGTVSDPSTPPGMARNRSSSVRSVPWPGESGWCRISSGDRLYVGPDNTWGAHRRPGRFGGS